MRDAKIDYIGSQVFRIDANHFSTNEASNILVVNVNKQLQASCLTILTTSLSNLYVCLSLGLVPKHDDDWRRIYDLFFSKNIFVNDDISCDRGALKYVAIDDAIIILIAQNQETMLLKKNFVDIFRHVLIAISNR